MSSDFEKWVNRKKPENISGDPRYFAEMGWKARQPEIDALESKVSFFIKTYESEADLRMEIQKENAALKAEVMKLSIYRDKYLAALEEKSAPNNKS